MFEWQPIIQQGAKVLVPRLLEAALGAASKRFQQRRPYASISFSNHFDYAFERCTKIKTIVNGDRPIDLLANYESPDFSSGPEGTRRVDEFAFIDTIKEKQKIALVGSAGAGKSMFMRYFWIACTITPKGKIPIFLELRKFNDIKQVDFSLFALLTATQGSIGDAKSLFQEAIDEGQFIFVLDGFDELKSDRRSNVEEWILTISRTKNTIVVSGRPDTVFESWQNFSVYKMLPMTLRQAASLISKVDFDMVVKTKFLRELKKTLYQKHRTFASRPLLATMMLLTFNSYADMPEKIHVFYDQAFDTLFSRHDATKEAFKRERGTPYSIDVFKKYLSYFALITYNENRTEFAESEILERIAKVATIENTKIEASAFLQDLLECVCILQKDGLNIVFSHRSFQEYFTAYCMVRLSDERVAELIRKFAWRSSDTVLPMLHDMNPDLLKRAYLFPALNKYVEQTKILKEESSLFDHIKAIGCGFKIRYTEFTGRENTILFSLAPMDMELVAIRLVVFTLHADQFSRISERSRFNAQTYHPRRDYPSFRAKVLPSVRRIKGGKFFSIMIVDGDGHIEFHDQALSMTHHLPDTALEACLDWLKNAQLLHLFWKEHQILLNLHRTLSVDQARKGRTLDEILS